MSVAMTFTPQHSSPLARTTSPFKNPRPAPCTPGSTAQIWDEYERRAMENTRRRDTTCTTSRRQTQQSRFSSGTVLDIIKSYDPHSSPKIPSMRGSPQFDFGFPTRQQPHLPLTESTTLAICKTCKRPITSNLGICESCKKIIVLSSPPPGEATPPPTPLTQTSTSTDLARGERRSFEDKPFTSASPKRRSRRSSVAHLIDPPTRLSSLKPPPSSMTPTTRPRKASLPGLTEHLPRLQISRKPVPLPASYPATPTTPPSTSHSYHSAPRTRPCSLANITTPPTTIGYRSTRHTSATPSELSTMFPYIASSTTTSPPSVCRASYQLQNTMSAWEDSDSEDEEKVGLVKYWRGRRWRGSRGSLGGQPVQARRDSAANEDEVKKAETTSGKKRRGFVRVISCGCNED